MSTKKLAIVSSYSESCGIATFSKLIIDSIKNFYPEVQVEIVKLDLNILQSNIPKIRKKADKHIRNICKKLSSFDAVNLQIEPGLYGKVPDDIVNRIGWLLKSHPNMSMTLHTPQLVGSNLRNTNLIKVGQFVLNGNLSGAAKELRVYMKSTLNHIQINHAIARSAIRNNAKIIVHTNRAKKQIKSFYDYDNVSVHPLQMIPEGFKPSSKLIENYRKVLKCDENDVLVGLFGFIGAYKGHTLALEALRILPPNYKLLIFGKQHPGTIKANQHSNEYIKKLTETIQNDSLLRKRVFFLGELSDDDFMNAAYGVDLAWLPYIETGQDGSGIASIVLDLNPRVLCSTAFVFDELFKLIPYKENVERFDIGNDVELAQKSQMMMDTKIKDGKAVKVEKSYDMKTQAAVYVDDLFKPASLIEGLEGLQHKAKLRLENVYQRVLLFVE